MRRDKLGKCSESVSNEHVLLYSDTESPPSAIQITYIPLIFAAIRVKNEMKILSMSLTCVQAMWITFILENNSSAKAQSMEFGKSTKYWAGRVRLRRSRTFRATSLKLCCNLKQSADVFSAWRTDLAISMIIVQPFKFRDRLKRLFPPNLAVIFHKDWLHDGSTHLRLRRFDQEYVNEYKDN